MFFGSVQTFKDAFDVQGDPTDIVIDFRHIRVYDHSGIEAIQNIADRYGKLDKKLHLLNVNKECSELIGNADNIVEVSIIKNLNH